MVRLQEGCRTTHDHHDGIRIWSGLTARVDKTAITNPDGSQTLYCMVLRDRRRKLSRSSISDNIASAMWYTDRRTQRPRSKRVWSQNRTQLLYTSVTPGLQIPGSGAKLRPSATHRVPRH